MKASLKVEGANLFNSLPKFLRNLDCSQDRFKSLLDLFLIQVLDKPNRKDYVSEAQNWLHKPSNSIKDWIRSQRSLNLDSWFPPLSHLSFKEKESMG